MIFNQYTTISRKVDLNIFPFYAGPMTNIAKQEAMSAMISTLGLWNCYQDYIVGNLAKNIKISVLIDPTESSLAIYLINLFIYLTDTFILAFKNTHTNTSLHMFV